ncbi:hypothetical protein AAC387_Pa06g0914 [Persea americana]
MPVLAKKEAEEGGMEDINPPLEVEEITHPGEAVLKVPLQNSEITRSGLPLSIRTIRIHRLIILTVLMTRVTDVEEVSIGHALVVHRREWWNNAKHTRHLFVLQRQMIRKAGSGI